MEIWGKRLKEIREKHELGQKDVGLVVDKDITQISRYERGEGAKKMPKTFRLELKELFTDEEIKYIESGDTSTQENNMVEDIGAVYGSKEEQVSVPFHREVYASAGGGSDSHSLENTSPVSFSRHFLNTFLGIYNLKGLSIINASGDSMDPTIKSGEMMFVSPMENEDFKDGGVYVLLVKRVTFNPLTKEYTLVSDNGRVDPVKLTIDEGSDCHFMGRVVGHLDRV